MWNTLKWYRPGSESAYTHTETATRTGETYKQAKHGKEYIVEIVSIEKKEWTNWLEQQDGKRELHTISHLLILLHSTLTCHHFLSWYGELVSKQLLICCTHPAVTEQQYNSFGVMFMATCLFSCESKVANSRGELQIQVIILCRFITMSGSFHTVTLFSRCHLIHCYYKKKNIQQGWNLYK